MPRKDNSYVPLREDTVITVGALPTGSAVIQAGLPMEQDVFITRSDIFVTLKLANADQYNGGFLFGIADGNLNAVAIAECLEADGPLFDRDSDRDILARKRVQLIGALAPVSVLRPTEDNGASLIWDFKHNTRMKFTEDGGSWNWFVYNLSGETPISGVLFGVLAQHHARWT